MRVLNNIKIMIESKFLGDLSLQIDPFLFIQAFKRQTSARVTVGCDHITCSPFACDSEEGKYYNSMSKCHFLSSYCVVSKVRH